MPQVLAHVDRPPLNWDPGLECNETSAESEQELLE